MSRHASNNPTPDDQTLNNHSPNRLLQHELAPPKPPLPFTRKGVLYAATIGLALGLALVLPS